MGGTCVNLGCIPKKLMSYAAHFHDDFAAAAGFGWTLGQRHFDWTTLIANKDKEIARLNGVYARLLAESGVQVIEGHARIEDGHTVTVGERTISARHILVATGGYPVRPSIPGAEHGITSDDFFTLPGLPPRAVINGGGYIAVELASILNGLGTEVTLVYRGARLLRSMDDDLGFFLAAEMTKKGVRIVINTVIDEVKAEGGIKHVHLSDGSIIDAECVLFATGRRPNTDSLGARQAGLSMNENGAIMVDEHFKTSADSIYAIGDVIDRVALTPVALAEGMTVARALFGEAGHRVSYDNIPTAVFSHPNVGTVGMTERQARANVGDVKIFKSEFKVLRHTLSGSGERTFLKLIVDAGNDRVLGLHMVGPDAGEVVQGFAVALQCHATKAQFDATIGIHPTLAEEFVTMRTPVA